ncbi:MAG: hypothetical protein AAGA48_25170 [Myxococcota bacterium]
MPRGFHGWVIAMVGCASPMTKAERALDKFADGETTAWHEARYAVESAILDPQLRHEPETWAIRGQVYLTQVGDPLLAALAADPLELSLRSYEAAAELGADEPLKARMRAEVPALEAVVQQRLAHHVTVRNWLSAAEELQLAQRVHRVNLSIGTGDIEREIALRRLACRVEAEAGDVERAADHYEALVAITQAHEMPLALDVILALKDRGRPKRARALALAASTALPDHLDLFEVRVGLVFDLGDPVMAKATVDERREALSASAEGALRAASLYQRIDASGLARMMWSRVIELQPDHFTARLALGQSIMRHAGAMRTTFRSEAGPMSRALWRSLEELWRQAEAHLQHAHRIEPARGAPLESLVQLYADKWAGIDPAALSPEDRDAFEADQVRRSSAEAMLAVP